MFRSREDRHFIDGSRVACPRRDTDVQIEECLACGRLINIVNDEPPYVLCERERLELRVGGEL